jgi:mannose-6-phosphate isomerase-like protein (cupin superfamily)
MKQLTIAMLLGIGYLAGYASSTPTLTAAQNPAGQAGRGPQTPPVHLTKSIYWSAETLKKGHADLAARAASGQAGGGNASPVSVRTPTLSMSMNHRRHYDQPQPSPTKIMSVWDDAESHDGNYDFYIVVGGSGDVVVDGPMENVSRVNGLDRPGEFRGQPITGGVTYKVKEGDLLLIPPSQPHWPKPDPGGLTYIRMILNLVPVQ